MTSPNSLATHLVVLVCSLMIATLARADEPFERTLFEASVERAAVGTGAVGIADLLDAAAVDEWLPHATAVSAFDELAVRADDPRVRELAAYLALRRVQAEGDPADVGVREDAMGFVTSWALIGPFPNDGMAGLTTRFGPETDGVDREATYDGKVVPISWRELTSADTGYVNLTPLVQPSWSAAAYLAADLDVSRTVDATLALAVDGAYRVWLDGEPVAEQAEHLGGWFMRDEIPVRLTRGRHQLLIKIAVDDSAMGLHARILDRDGRPIDVDARPASRAGMVATEPDAWPQAPSLAGLLAPGADASPAELAAAAAVLASFQAADPSEPWMPLVERALAGDGLDATTLMRLADAVPEHWRRVELLQRATRADADDPIARLALAAARYEEMGEASRAEGLAALRELVGEHPSWGEARLAEAHALMDAGLYYAHLEALQALSRDLEAAAPVRAPLLAALERMNRADLRLDAARDALDVDRASVYAARAYADALRAAGQIDGARVVVSGMLERLPENVAARELAAHLAVAEDDLGGAAGHLTDAIALSPGDATLYRRRAELRLERGDVDGAAADFEAALARAPQDSDARDYLARISSDVDAFWESFRVDVDGLIALRATSPPVADVEFEWLVDQRIIHVYPNGLATTYVQQAFDVRTRNGADALRATSLVYSPDSEVVDIVAVRVVKADGSIREVYDSDDRGPGSGPSSIYYDVRSRSLFFPTLEEGDILSYEYTIADVSYRNIFDDYFGDLMFVQSHQPRAFVRWAALMPQSRPLFVNDDTLPFGNWSVENRGADRLVSYEAHDVPRIEREANAPGPAERFAYLSASTYDDWNELADWYWHLVEDQLVLSPAIERTVAELIDGVDDERERISAIHEYVVRNTRYVGLEFGIHGFKPYRTSDCFQRRFGDCKDTASLMKVMLEAAGIEAHLVLVRTRDLGNIDAHPPSLAVFNHAITYVPAYDLYLDGTAGFSGSGELPTLDQGASAVIVLDREGGRFGRIPELPAADSTRTTRMSITLDDDGARGQGELTLTGSFAPGMRRAYESADQPVEQFSQQVASGMPGVRVTSAEFSDMTDITVPVHIAYEFEGGDWATAQADGTRVVHPLGADADLAGQLAGASSRRSPLELDHEFVLDERLEIAVPDGWSAESLPAAETTETRFGNLSYRVTFEDGVLIGEMRFELDAVRVDAADYDDFRAFVVAAEMTVNQVVRFDTEER